jgi:membrane-bound serine protease (ClpP class)
MGRALMRTVAIAMLAVGLLASESGAQVADPEIVVLRLDGVVDPLVADYLERGIQRAQDEGEAAILLEIDTPGGLDSSMRQITEAILGADIPVICYVSPAGARAASAGAFILLSCPVAAMAPGTNVGASTPVGLDGGDLATKIANDAAAYIRSIAETYDRDVATAESFVREGASISAEEARSRGVIDTVAGTRDELLAGLDGASVALATGATVTLETSSVPVREQGMGGFMGFLHDLLDPNLAFIFFWLGLALIVLEVLIPGHVFSGTIGTIMLITAIVSFGLLPVRVIGIALLILSVIGFVVELNSPGLGIWGAIGVVSLVLGGWFLYDRSAGAAVSPLVLLPVATLMALFFGFVVAKAIRLRHVPPSQGAETIVGALGVAVGAGVDGRGGIVRVHAEEWRAVTAGEAIPAGDKIRVTRLDGLVLTVEPLIQEHLAAADVPATEEGGNA